MTFVKPGLLFGWLVIAIAFVWVVRLSLRSDTILRRWIQPQHWESVLPEYFPQGRLIRRVLLLLALGAALTALARPQWGEREETSPVTGLDVMIALDLSSSMNVEDLAPSRLARAKHWLKSFIGGLDGDRVGLLGFGSSAHVFVPLTQDLAFVQDQLQTLSPKMITNQGTDIGLALEAAAQTLERGSENELLPGGEEKTPSHALLLVTDGEDHEGAAADVAKKLKGMGVQLYVLGVGTERGGPVPVLDENGNKVTYKKDRGGQPIVSHFAGKSLQTLAAAGGGEYWNLTSDESELKELLGQVGKLQRGDLAEKKIIIKEDRYQWPLGLGILLLLAEFFVPLHRIRLDAKAAFLIVGLLMISNAPAHAGVLDDLRGYWNHRAGIQALREGRLDDAQRDFGEAQKQMPSRGEPAFNQGVTQLKKGDTEGALQSFAQGAEQAGGDRVRGIAHYNEGWVRAQKKDYLGAARSYLDAIRSAQKSGDHELEEKARKNLELLQQQQQEDEKKKSDQDKKGENKDDQKKDQSGEKSKPEDQSSKDEDKNQESDSKKSPSASGLKHKRTPFRSEKLSPEDADRVLNELQGKETELRGKLRKQMRKTQTTTQDW